MSLFRSLVRRYKEKYDLVGILFIGPPIIYLFLIIIYPLITIFPASFQEYVPSSQSFVFVGLKQFQRLFADKLFWLSIKTTFAFAGFTVILHLLLAWALALLLNTRWWPSWRVRNLFRAVLLFPWIFSPAACALLWGILYHPRGFLSYFSQQLLHTRIGFLSDPKVALWSVLLVNGWNWYPFYMIILLGGLQSIDRSLYESSEIDGANRFQSFFHITLPLMTPLMMMIVIIDFIGTFIVFDLVWIMTKGGPLRTTYLISFFLYEKGLMTYKLGYASAVSVFMALFLSAFVAVYLILYLRRSKV